MERREAKLERVQQEVGDKEISTALVDSSRRAGVDSAFGLI